MSKRKHSESAAEKFRDDSPSDDFDISSALTNKKRVKTLHSVAHEDQDDDFADFIQSSIATRSVKEGTQIVKKAKGKEKMTKGEVGGGSFQSMGRVSFHLSKVAPFSPTTHIGLHPSLLRSLTLQGYRLPTPTQRTIPALLINPPREPC